MATRGIVPRANGEGSIGTEKKHWGGGFFDKLAVRTLEVIGGGTENDAQPATVGWVKQGFEKLLKSTIEASGIRVMGGHNASYVCFGNLFGNLTIQWGMLGWDVGKFYKDVVYPISYRKSCRTIVVDTSFNVGENGISELDKSIHLLIDEGKSDLTKCRIISSMTDVGAFSYLSIGF